MKKEKIIILKIKIKKKTETQTHNIYSHFKNKLEDDQNNLSDIIDSHFQQLILK